MARLAWARVTKATRSRAQRFLDIVREAPLYFTVHFESEWTVDRV